MSLRDEIKWRLGAFARPVTFANCGIGPNGFQPGNTCGGEHQGGSSGAETPKSGGGAAGIEARAKAAGKSFTEQWLQETRQKIDEDYRRNQQAEARASGRKRARLEKIVKKKEAELERVKKAGPQPKTSPRKAAIQVLEQRLAESRSEQGALAKRHAEERAAGEQRLAELRARHAARNTPEGRRAAAKARETKQALAMVNRERKRRGLAPLKELSEGT